MILINGQYQQQISARDRALHYGDGLFETFAVVKGQTLAWDRHIARLQTGCERLVINCPDLLQLASEAARLCEGVRLGVLKLIISRGEGGRGYQAPQPAQTTRIFSLHDWPDYPAEYQQEGIKASVCKMRLGHSPALAGIKHLNRLEQVLLRQELSTGEHAEGIALDIDDKVIEGSMSNIFIIKNGQLLTPDLSRAGVAGIIRGSIIESHPDCEVTTLTLDDVLQAEEVFFCNSIAGIWPVIRINHTCYEVGRLTRELQNQLVDKNMIVMK